MGETRFVHQPWMVVKDAQGGEMDILSVMALVEEKASGVFLLGPHTAEEEVEILEKGIGYNRRLVSVAIQHP
jgi:hypothetical protein